MDSRIFFWVRGFFCLDFRLELDDLLRNFESGLREVGRSGGPITFGGPGESVGKGVSQRQPYLLSSKTTGVATQTGYESAESAFLGA